MTPRPFAVIVDGQLLELDRYEDLPAVFDRLVRFIPPVPPGPHTPAQHEATALWPARLAALMSREREGRRPSARGAAPVEAC